MGLAVACGKKNEEAAAGKTDEDIVIAENEFGEEDGNSEDGEEEEDEDAYVVELSQEDADALVAEKTSPLNFTPVYNEQVVNDKNTYYTYTVLDENEEEIEQLLAVDAVSGEVSVYDLENDKILPYSDFKYYNAETDEVVDWNGTFKNGQISVTLLPADEVNFEFTFEGGGVDKLVGVATLASNRKAVYEDEKVCLVFNMKGDTLTIIDGDDVKSGYAGEYKKN
ncbi:MAG: hypothetical protein K6F99_05625 [Lachnospiraceae bacterium]|nr:hypothetical protein [Lachnospiraceae bacterium]